MTYEEAVRRAQRMADDSGFDFGVESSGNQWRAFMLPQRRNRSGFELTCEVRMCSDLSRCRPGHGPMAKG